MSEFLQKARPAQDQIMPIKPEYKVTLLGSGGVGKSALTLRIISGVFTPTYNPTIEDYYRHDTNVDGVGPCIVEILDTAGTEQFASMRQLYITNGQAFALVYSIDDRASFEEAKDIFQQISEVKTGNAITVILVGNKCDLEDRREVETTEGLQAAKSMGNCPFVETSAKDGTNVAEFFASLVMAVDGRVKISSNGVLKRAPGNHKSLRRSFRMGRRTRREKSRSQPDLRTYSATAAATDYFGLPAASPGPNAIARKRCVIM